MKKIFPILIMILFSFGAAAATPPSAAPTTGSVDPVEISAAKSLEWNRKAKTYTARKDVIVRQGGVSLRSDVLVTKYDEKNGVVDITTLTANGNVTIISPPYTAQGDEGVYDVKTGNATLTGENLRITTDGDTLTAQEKIEFSGAENRMTAIGDATAVHDGNILTADRLSAFFVKDDGGKTSASKISADGRVTIKTAKETATGDAGIYDVKAQKAVLTGKVRIRQGENWLEGTRADIDMATGMSRLSGVGDATTDGRVKGVFYPKSRQD